VFIQMGIKKSIILDVSPSSTIEDIKYQYQQLLGIPYGSQRLYFAKEQLEDHKTLRDYNISENATIHCTMRLTGSK
ncbi:polyubiquitin, partial [Trichophaea hybrida]